MEVFKQICDFLINSNKADLIKSFNFLWLFNWMLIILIRISKVLSLLLCPSLVHLFLRILTTKNWITLSLKISGANEHRNSFGRLRPIYLSRKCSLTCARIICSNYSTKCAAASTNCIHILNIVFKFTPSRSS